MSGGYSLDDLDVLDDEALARIDWKNNTCLNRRLLVLHAEGALGNEELAKLPLEPILCIDQIGRIDEEAIEASFSFPDTPEQWPYDPEESLEMLFQDQLDQLVGFWGARKANGIGRALSSGVSKQHQSLDFQPGKSFHFRMQRRKWVENQETGTATAVFNGRIDDDQDQLVLETKNVIVGILPPADILALRQRYGGTGGVSSDSAEVMKDLRIPIYDTSTVKVETDGSGDQGKISRISATQQIQPDLWPLRFHFRGDPVVPGNFGTHGMIALLKQVAREHFGIGTPLFQSLSNKKFSGMIFEDPKQITFELLDVEKQENGSVVANAANLYLETQSGERMIETPIYTYKKISVGSSLL